MNDVSATLLLCELGKVKKAAATGDIQQGESNHVLAAIPSEETETRQVKRDIDNAHNRIPRRNTIDTESVGHS